MDTSKGAKWNKRMDTSKGARRNDIQLIGFSNKASPWLLCSRCSQTKRPRGTRGTLSGTFELAVVEVGVEAALGQELLMGALLNDVSVVHDQDHVSIADCG